MDHLRTGSGFGDSLKRKLISQVLMQSPIARCPNPFIIGNTNFRCQCPLKELVEVKVRKLVDGLPFTEEGYNKAKGLLAKRYGQTSEVVGAYVRSILELPSIRERDVAKLHAFYETLLYKVESLQTLDSLGKLYAAVRFTFDKLEVIQSGLAMTNENWNE